MRIYPSISLNMPKKVTLKWLTLASMDASNVKSVFRKSNSAGVQWMNTDYCTS